jgi:hypothetical protein
MKEVKRVYLSGDALSMFAEAVFYCVTRQCSRFGDLTIAGIFETRVLPPQGGQTKEELSGTVNKPSPDSEKEEGSAE